MNTPSHLIVATAALALAAGAAVGVPPAVASGTHTCRQGDPPLVASASTSCPLAGAIFSAWDRQPHDGTTFTWRGRVSSPLTHRSYLVACRITGSEPWAGWYDVRCQGPGSISVRFPTEVTP